MGPSEYPNLIKNECVVVTSTGLRTLICGNCPRLPQFLFCCHFSLVLCIIDQFHFVTKYCLVSVGIIAQNLEKIKHLWCLAYGTDKINDRWDDVISNHHLKRETEEYLLQLVVFKVYILLCAQKGNKVQCNVSVTPENLKNEMEVNSYTLK